MEVRALRLCHLQNESTEYSYTIASDVIEAFSLLIKLKSNCNGKIKILLCWKLIVLVA